MIISNCRSRGLMRLIQLRNTSFTITLELNLWQTIPTNHTRHHTGPIHTHVRPYCIHMDNSPTQWVCIAPHSPWQEYVGLLEHPYIKCVPLPNFSNQRVPVRDSQLPHVKVAAPMSMPPSQLTSSSYSDPTHMSSVCSPNTTAQLNYVIWCLHCRLIDIKAHQ